ncbi:HAMP domain-containing protein [Heliobacterium undosum]|uniref:HAMP domain-containing protein n=1 Tax=Heliomicrobium undosum TaxID=121734 RepID=A0A845L426_9FIRM|nr:methyl-accepting chemotaxis protein [Heliomicrobium undosum]MZP30456.1 HAMP domain-containing protein [Heliomicrobium undosum]
MFIFVMLVVAISSIAGIVYYNVKTIFEGQIKTTLTSETKGVASDVGNWYHDVRDEAEMLSQSPARKQSPDEARNYLLAEMKRKPHLFSLMYGEADGYATGNLPRTFIGDRDFYKKAVETGKTVTSSPIISKNTGKAIINTMVPVMENGSFQGFVLAGIALDKISEKISTYKIGQNGYAYLLHRNGMVVAHPEKDLPMKANFLKDENVPPKFKEVNEQMANGESGLSSFYGSNNRENYISFAPVPGLDWSVAVVIPADEVLAPFHNTIQIILMVSLLILFAVGALTYYLSTKAVNPIIALKGMALQMAGGDLTVDYQGIKAGADEVGELTRAFQTMADNLRTLVGQVQDNTSHVAESSRRMLESSEQTVLATQQIALSSQEVAMGSEETVERTRQSGTSVRELSNSIQVVLERTQEVAKAVNEASANEQKGRQTLVRVNQQMGTIQQSVNDSARVINTLGDRSQAIGQIVEVISNIATQTNMLALNAAIEAARAGEQGRGFAVVADEVRKLAEQSGSAANEIRHLIEEIQVNTNSAVQTMTHGTATVEEGSRVVSEVNKFFDAIANSIADVLANTELVAESVQEMVAKGNGIHADIEKIKEIAQRSSAGSENMAAATQEQVAIMEQIKDHAQTLGQMSDELRNLVLRFHV